MKFFNEQAKKLNIEYTLQNTQLLVALSEKRKYHSEHL